MRQVPFLNVDNCRIEKSMTRIHRIDQIGLQYSSQAVYDQFYDFGARRQFLWRRFKSTRCSAVAMLSKIDDDDDDEVDDEFSSCTELQVCLFLNWLIKRYIQAKPHIGDGRQKQ